MTSNDDGVSGNHEGPVTDGPLPDADVVAVQIGRPPRSAVEVVARCHLRVPVVITVPPYLDDGVPFPTRYWLTCPLAVRRIGRIEAAGGVKAAEARIDDDVEFAGRHRSAMQRYASDRDALIPDDAPPYRPSGGVGGARRGVKCLHAHYADHAAGNDNPVGEQTATSVEPLDCATRCVALIHGAVVANPAWEEPRHDGPQGAATSGG